MRLARSVDLVAPAGGESVQGLERAFRQRQCRLDTAFFSAERAR